MQTKLFVSDRILVLFNNKRSHWTFMVTNNIYLYVCSVYITQPIELQSSLQWVDLQLRKMIYYDSFKPLCSPCFCIIRYELLVTELALQSFPARWIMYSFTDSIYHEKRAEVGVCIHWKDGTFTWQRSAKCTH